VRPWGVWGPIQALVMADDPAFVPNRDAPRDAFNIVFGIVWQLALMALRILVDRLPGLAALLRFDGALVHANPALAARLGAPTSASAAAAALPRELIGACERLCGLARRGGRAVTETL